MDSTNSISVENQDVDKSIFDAEQFLSNFTSLREECDRLKSENHELQMRLQQLTQDLGQCQIDKQNLERHIQKETLRHKETVWNIKLEMQKSQEERLSWKEKYLDLCIRSSQNVSKDDGTAKENTGTQEMKKSLKKAKKKYTKKKLKQEIVEESSTSAQNTELSMEDDSMTASQKTLDTEPSAMNVNHSPQTETVASSQVEPLSLETSLPAEETTNMNTADMVTSLESNMTSADGTQTHVVTTDAADYYSLQGAPFDLTNQGQPVSGNTTTFILQTSDATFCATAVMDNSQQANTYGNTTVPFELKTGDSRTFSNQNSFHNNMPDSGSESEETKEFNFRCSMCNFTYSDQIGLDKHMKAKHTAKTNLCKECGKAYSTKSSLAQHVHHYHRHPMAYDCDVCKKKFNRKDFLIKHLKTHTQDRSFQCNHCEKQFKTRASLSAHVNGSHNDKRRFVCDFCGMRTSWRLSYLEHMKLHTGEPRKSGRKKKIDDIQHPDLQQLVAEPGTVVQFITTES